MCVVHPTIIFTIQFVFWQWILYKSTGLRYTVVVSQTRRIAMSEYTDKELETIIAERDYAEAHGLYDTIENPSGLMTPEQEMALAQAMSTLSDLAKETNSSMSELIKVGKL